MTLVSHGWIFPLLRRPLSGYEPVTVRLFLLASLPAYVVSLLVFQALQESLATSSLLNSDIASVVFAGVSLAQWLGVSVLFSIHRSRRAY